jgi:hypothetical protein
MPQTTRLQPQSLFFHSRVEAENSVVATIIEEVERLIEFDPAILVKIDEDRDQAALEKKLLRVKDASWCNEVGLFPSEDQNEELTLDNLVLLEGRRRMPAVLVLVFSMVRGWIGGSKDEMTRTMLAESRSVEEVLAQYGWKMPGASTITDNCNMVSRSTLEYIFAAELRMAKTEALDDYEKAAFDSTAVESYSAFPTDSEIISKLLSRARHGFEILRSFGLEANFTQGVEMRIEEVIKLGKEIALVSGKKVKQKRKKLYLGMYSKALASKGYLQRGLARLEQQRAELRAKPSVLARVKITLLSVANDLDELEKAIEASKARIKESKKVSSKEKPVSVSDADAAIIVKGGRVAVLGYKPQLGRSESGLITAFALSPGNGADSTQLMPLVNLHIANTGVTPHSVSFDDGYSSKEGINQCLDIPGVKNVSVGGAKGKKVIPPEIYESQEYRELRCFRSVAESTIGHLKQCQGFGACVRTGIDAVRQEMLEKIICFNLRKISKLRRRKEA